MFRLHCQNVLIISMAAQIMCLLRKIAFAKRARTSLISIAIVGIFVITACVSEDDLTADQRAYQLSQQLMCPVCDGQTLDQSQAQISQDMKAVIRDKLEAGDTNEQIRAYFIQRYGEAVLAAPDSSGFNLVAWIMPFIIFAGGVLIVANALRRMKKQPKLAPETSQTDIDTVQPDEDRTQDDHLYDDDVNLQPYLDRVDRHFLALTAKSSRDQSEDST